MIDRPLILKENTCFQTASYRLEIDKYIGTFSPEVHAFRVNFIGINAGDDDGKQAGLFRIGTPEGGLQRELELRNLLPDYGLIAPFLENDRLDNILIDIYPEPLPYTPEGEGEYLDETVIDDPPANIEFREAIFILTPFPDEGNNLRGFIEKGCSEIEALSIAIATCQVFSHFFRRGWCCIDLIPEFIEIGRTLKFHDLTATHAVGESGITGFTGLYRAGSSVIDEKMAVYTIGALLYHLLFGKKPTLEDSSPVEIEPIPMISQILNISLSPYPEERFSLSQLLSLAIEARKYRQTPRVNWISAGRSSVGLSPGRLHNEDNYGIRQYRNGDREYFLLAAIADGMGGMADGEKASAIAIRTLLTGDRPFETLDSREISNYLVHLFDIANESIAREVKNGGTTLSAILARNDLLTIAHVGDSRIYRIREGKIDRLSEDHTMISLLLKSGEITLEESLNHPDRNILIRSLGDKPRLNPDYVQTASCNLKHGDIFLLCSDGVWDLVHEGEMLEIFTPDSPLATGVEEAIDRVLKRGANDNATLLALQCYLEYSF